jgi:E3 ubiquitin-protein ligase NEDD4
VIKYRFVQRIETQMNALKKGFQDILPLPSIKMFDEKEVEVKQHVDVREIDQACCALQLLISGLGEINLDDWRKFTMYKGGYTPDNIVIQWFWQVNTNGSHMAKSKRTFPF